MLDELLKKLEENLESPPGDRFVNRVEEMREEGDTDCDEPMEDEINEY